LISACFKTKHLKRYLSDVITKSDCFWQEVDMQAAILFFLCGLWTQMSLSQELKFQDRSVTMKELLAAQSYTQLKNINLNDVYIVQFPESPSQKIKEKLIQSRLQILNYFPENAFLVRGMTYETMLDLQSWTLGVVKFPTTSKLSLDLPTISIFNESRELQVHLILWHERDLIPFIESLPRSAYVLEAEGRFVDLRITGKELLELAESCFVEAIEPQPEVTLMYADITGDAYPYNESAPFQLTGFETGTRLMGFESTWLSGYAGRGQVVAFSDTGLDRGEGNLSKDFLGGVMGGLAVGVGASNWHDPMGHGTHVAGSVAARGGYSQGQIKGGAYEAQLFAFGMWSPILNNLSVPPRLNRLFAPAYENGIKIFTNSWGSPVNLGAYNSMAIQADEWAWENLDFLALFAAGNSGADKNKDGKIDEGSISSPGTAKNVLTVGASENQVFKGGIQRPIKDLKPAQELWPAEPIYSSFLSDNPRGIAAFSSRGPTRDKRLKPEVVAPGSNILSSFSREPGANTLWGAYDEYHVFSGGTSMSTPLVAGAVAITRQMLVEKAKISNPSASLLKALIMLGSEDLFPGQYGIGAHQELNPRPDYHQGFGLVQLPKIQSLVERGNFVEGLAVDAKMVAYKVSLNAGDQLEVILVYTDAPGTANSGRSLVNDLDLSITGPGNVALLSQSRTDNFEFLKLSAPIGGEYELRIDPVRIAVMHPKLQGQPFSLVYLVY